MSREPKNNVTAERPKVSVLMPVYDGDSPELLSKAIESICSQTFHNFDSNRHGYAPITEETGLPYASRIRTRDSQDRDVGVMHALLGEVIRTRFFGG